MKQQEALQKILRFMFRKTASWDSNNLQQMTSKRTIERKEVKMSEKFKIGGFTHLKE